MRKSKSGSEYPQGWATLAEAIKADVDWKCVRCGHPHEPHFVLTVHHLDMNPSNNAWWNLVPLCQQCHLRIQAKVILERNWMFEHSAWFKPYVAGYYAERRGLPHDKIYVMEHLEEILQQERLA